MDAEKQSRERKTLSRDTEVVESQHLQKAAGWGGLGKSRLGPSVQEHQYPHAGVQALPYVHLGDKEVFHRGQICAAKKSFWYPGEIEFCACTSLCCTHNKLSPDIYFSLPKYNNRNFRRLSIKMTFRSFPYT